MNSTYKLIRKVLFSSYMVKNTNRLFMEVENKKDGFMCEDLQPQ